MLSEVLSDISALIRSQDGRLVALTLVCPPAARDEVRIRVARRLGNPDLEIRFEDAPGPLRVLTAEFASEAAK